jgi:molybdate transport system substrate-binding protein
VTVLLAAGLLGGVGCAKDPTETVTLYAAASVGPALEEIGRRFERERGVRVAGDWASSALLARRVGAGAPAQVFLSANPKWIAWLEERGRLEPGTRVDLLGNSLVVIAPKGRAFDLPEARGLAGAFEGRLALADPDHVPAGEYARQALQAAGDWAPMIGRIVPAADVRAALLLVERGACGAGIVYRTDAVGSPRVEIVADIPEDRHRPIVYPVALVRNRARPAAVALFQFLRSPVALEIFERHGFRVLATPLEPASAGR